MTYTACYENLKMMKEKQVSEFKLQLSLKPALFCGLLSQTIYLTETWNTACYKLEFRTFILVPQ